MKKHLSRILSRLEQQSLIEKVRSDTDGRLRLIHLTSEGREAFTLLDQRSKDEVGEILKELYEEEQQRLLSAMNAIRQILDKNYKYSNPYVLRPHELGGWDLGLDSFRNASTFRKRRVIKS